jgi:dephospho-CoA kinase
MPLIVGVTGGIGSGKTTVAQRLAERGATVIDADQISRDLVVPGSPVLDELASEFGAHILHEDGSLNRAQLAADAFSDPERTKRLNAIMHPKIQHAAAEKIAESACDVVVYDMPLLFETGQQALVDVVLVVDVPTDVQVDRAVQLRGLPKDDVERRMAVQIDRETRRHGADYVIDNSGTVDQTLAQVDEVWHTLTSRTSGE